MKIFHYH